VRELTDHHHQQAGLGLASFLLLKLSLYLLLSKLHTSASPQAVKEGYCLKTIKKLSYVFDK